MNKDLSETSISSAGDSPARTYPLPDVEQVLLENGQDFSGTRLLSQRTSKRDGLSWRTSPGYLHQIKDAISEQSSLHWPKQGICMSNGECLTRNSLESPNVAVVSLLSQVLQTEVDDRYLLSPKAAAGILRRAGRRGKKLPERLEGVLRLVAGRATPTE